MTNRIFFATALSLVLAACAHDGGGHGGGSDAGGSGGHSGARLTGTTWKLERIHGHNSIGSKASLTISPEGRIGGNTGCNAMFGHATIDGQKIAFGQMGSTKMACTQDGVMEQERAYTAALQQVARWRIKDGDLYLTDRGNVDILVFEED